MRGARIGWATTALAAAMLACSGGGGSDAASDAAPIDGAGLRPDAEDLCPGRLTIEGEVSDLETDEALFEFALRETASPGNQAVSAPNGRVVLCVDQMDTVDVEVAGEAALERSDRISRAAMARLRGAGAAHPFAMLSNAHLATLAADLDVAPPDATTTIVLVHVVTVTGAPLLGAEVSLDVAARDPLTRQADGTFLAGRQIADGGLVLVSGVPVDPAPVVTILPPAGFGGGCTGPSALAPRAEATSGAVFVCQE